MSTDQHKFELLFNTINDFIIIIDKSSNIVEINEAALRALEYKHEEIIGKSILFIHPADTHQLVTSFFSEMLEGKRNTCPIPLISKSGKYTPIETTVKKGKWDNEDVFICVSRNISTLAHSEAKFQKVFENNQAMMSITDIKSGRFIDVNDQFLVKMGYHKEEIIGNTSINIQLYDNPIQREKFIDKFNSIKEVDNQYVILRTKSGEKKHVMFSGTVIRIESTEYLLISAIDVSELTSTEEKLKSSLKYQTMLADISQQFISIKNLSEKVNYLLQAVGNHLDIDCVYIYEELPSKEGVNNKLEWHQSNHSQKSFNSTDNHFSTSCLIKELLIKQGTFVASNSEERPIEIIQRLESLNIKSILAFPLYTQNVYYGFIALEEYKNNKIWEAEHIELIKTISVILSNAFTLATFQEKLQESELRLSSALDNTVTGLWDYNLVTGDVIFNDMLCKMVGYEKDEIIPHISTWYKHIHPDDMEKTFKLLEDHINGKTPLYSSIHRLRTKSGDWKWILDKGKVVEYNDKDRPTRIIGTHTDIDSQKRIEEELRILNATKDKIFSIISHDLRGPIGTIMKLSELVSEKNQLDQETIDEILSSQKELSQTTFQLLENLLNWARVNMDQIHFVPRIISLNPIIEETLLGIKYQAQAKDITIYCNLCDKYYAFADEEMIKLVFRNLLSNALKFTPTNGNIKISITKRLEEILISIIDNGIGISEDNINKVLSDNQFFSSYGTSNEKGNGIGLKLCKSFISTNKGELYIKSEIGKGSNFSFTLPIPNYSTLQE